ncbi:MAG: carboxymuconolactone decarboxylase family protein [Balneolaceae bacterium]
MTTSVYSATENVHFKNTEPRLRPIEKPNSLKLKLAYWFTKKRLGKVITPVKVHSARFPEGLGLSAKMAGLEKKITINPELKHLIKVYVATLNGCAFCVDIGKASAKMNGIKTGKFEDLLRFEESSRFNKSEKAALAYVDEVTRNKHVSDETFSNLRIHFNEEEIVQITLMNAVENFYNLMNAPLNIGSDELCELLNQNS